MNLWFWFYFLNRFYISIKVNEQYCGLNSIMAYNILHLAISSNKTFANLIKIQWNTKWNYLFRPQQNLSDWHSNIQGIKFSYSSNEDVICHRNMCQVLSSKLTFKWGLWHRSTSHLIVFNLLCYFTHMMEENSCKYRWICFFFLISRTNSLLLWYFNWFFHGVKRVFIRLFLLVQY